MNRSYKIPLWFIVFVVAYLARLIYVIEISDMPYFTAPAVDAEYHDNWAQDIASGDFTFDEGPFFRAPLYPFFLGAVYSVFGHNYFVIRIIQALIGAFSCVLVYLLGKRLFNHRVGAIAGFIAALSGILIYFEAELLIPVLLIPLNMGMLLMLFKARDEDRNVYWWLGGLLFGLSAIARPNILIISPLIIYFISRRIPVGQFFRRIGFVLAGFVLPLIPVTYHNLSQGEFVLIATQGGVNFYIGNNEESDGASAVFPGLNNNWRYEDAVNIAEKELGVELSQREVSGYYYGRGFEFILKEPIKWLKLMLHKFLLLINYVEISNNKNIYFAAKDSIILTVLLNYNSFWFYGSLGILGMVMFYRRGFEHRFLVWMVLLYSFSILLFFVTARYRLPLVPLFMVFAAAVIDRLIYGFQRREIRRIIVPLIAGVISMLVVGSNLPRAKKISEAYAHFSLGNAYQKQGELGLAEQEYLKTLQFDPNYVNANLNLGVIYYNRGEYEKAEELFRREIAINPGFGVAFAYNNLGNIRVRLGKLTEAIPFYETALKIYPAYEDGKINLAQTYHDAGLLQLEKGLLDTAIVYLKKAVDLFPDNPGYRYNYALVLGEMGEEEKAVEQMRKVVEIATDFEPAQRVIRAYERQHLERRR